MSAIGSVASGMKAIHQTAGRPAPVKVNDGDADDAPKVATATKLATSGPGQLINKLA